MSLNDIQGHLLYCKPF